ncbi:MAG: hypothetical protein HGA45_41860, partial [Chloroflexales bacterium]|nr:hypothetical protein [Chloroflexales bacterium]
AGGAVSSIAGGLRAPGRAAWSPDGRSIAFAARTAATRTSDIYLLTLDRPERPVNLTNSPFDDEEPAWSPDSERIAFTRTREGNSDVFVMLASGAAQTRLTSDPGFDGEPSWSPDGARIALRSDRSGKPGIAVMDDSGRNIRSLSPALVAERTPAWQPASDAVVGEQLLFTTGLGRTLRQIALVNANGTGRHTLVAEPDHDATMAAWSPDGAWIAFASDRDGTYDIFVAPADGSAAANLTDHPAKDMYPAWSPDGTRIAFESFRDGNWDVFVMNSDGSGLVNLTSNPASDGNPAWSPDGARIAFVSDRDGPFDVYVTEVSGVEPPRQLTADPALDAYPAWSPSGGQLAFRSDRRGNRDIYLLDVATGQSRLFTPSEANDDQPSWSPDGTRIAFVSDRGAVDSDGSYDIYVKSVQGSSVVRMTATAEREQFPRWRPR